MLALLSRLKACGKCKTAVTYNNTEAKRARLALLEPLQPWTGDGDPPKAQNRNAVSNVDKCMTTAIQLVSGVFDSGACQGATASVRWIVVQCPHHIKTQLAVLGPADAA
jgi:hypothetical protein